MSRPLDRLLAEVVEIGETVDSPKTIDAYFRKLCKYRLEVQLYFQQDDRHFKSRVLAADAKGILLDQLLPEVGNDLLSQGHRPALLANIDGVCLCIPELPNTEQITETDSDDRLYRCAMPSSLLQIQRREAYRVKMRQNEPINVELEHGELILSGQMLDLSATGCRCLIRFGDSDLPQVGDKLQLRFTLPDGTEIECQNEVRHCVQPDNSEGNGFYIVGLQFVRLSGMYERQVSLLVSRLQREERQLNSQS